MNAGRVLAILVIGMAFIASAVGTSSAAPSKSWLATGTVTKIKGPTVYMLGKDNHIYKVDATNATVIISGCTTNCYDMAVGDKVRVFGVKCAPGEVAAQRIRVLRGAPGQAGAGPGEKVIKIVVEKQPPEEPAAMQPQPPQPAVSPVPETWQGKGVITDINYPGRQIKIQTSEGNWTIDLTQAMLTNGSVRTSFGALSVGDTVQVYGDPSGSGEVQAARVKVLRTQYEAQGAVSLQPVSMAGVIQQVDYASRTFKMQGQSYNIVVSVDDKTVIQDTPDQFKALGFDGLRPGMRVKVSGHGSLASGFAAQHIQIISTAP